MTTSLTPEQFEESLMRRVYLAAFLTRLSFAKILLGFFSFLSFIELFIKVSILHVFQNAPGLQSLEAHRNFWGAAWAGADGGVQIALVLFALCAPVFLGMVFIRKSEGFHSPLRFLKTVS